MGKLTVGKVRALTVPGRYGDGGTLHLVVSPRGTKHWVQRITIAGRRRDIGLGGWSVVPLAMARDRAFSRTAAPSPKGATRWRNARPPGRRVPRSDGDAFRGSLRAAVGRVAV